MFVNGMFTPRLCCTNRGRLHSVMSALTLTCVSGCGIGGMWMEGKPLFLSEYSPPQKFITFWNQPGVNEEQKMQDWLACPGGTRNGGFGYDMTKQKPDETDAMTMRRLENNFYRCLIRKGYRYRACEVGKMLDEVICEAPPKP